MTETSLLHMTAPLREDFDIPCHRLGSGTRPLLAALVAGIHGNELNGIFVLARLAAFLRSVWEGRYPEYTLTGQVVIVPAVNVLGVNTRHRHWPFDNTDINRMFPGYAAGETTQRVAHAVFETTREARFRVDIHSSNLDLEELPQVRLYDASDAEREHATWFGLPAVIERPSNTVFENTIGHSWRRLGGENYVLQAGQAGYLQHRHCEQLFRGLVGFLLRAGVVGGGGTISHDTDVHLFGCDHAFALMADVAGMFVSTLRVGDWVQAGQLIGHVYDGFDGRALAQIKSPVAGLVTALRRQPLLFEGDLIARIHMREPQPGFSDLHIHGQGQ